MDLNSFISIFLMQELPEDLVINGENLWFVVELKMTIDLLSVLAKLGKVGFWE